jgi:mRNA-degrading endonuclease YafQ of YafQ-DinJ toxin-antitoxin module
MLNPTFTGPFKKDRKLMKKRNRNMDKLTETLAMLINEQPLLPKHENRRIIFYRTGSHSDLF